MGANTYTSQVINALIAEILLDVHSKTLSFLPKSSQKSKAGKSSVENQY